MALCLFLSLNNDTLTKIFFESKRLLKGLQLCKKVRMLLLKELSLGARGCLSHLVVKDMAKLRKHLRRSPSLPGKCVLWPEGINVLVSELECRGPLLKDVEFHLLFPNLTEITQFKPKK